MDNLRITLQHTLLGYTGKGLNGYSYLTANEEKTLFTVTTVVDSAQEGHYAFCDLIVRLVGNVIVIEEDRNNKTLFEALLQAGVARDQIVRTYAGEAVPQPASLEEI